MNNIEVDNLIVFTDGSCIANGYTDAAGGYGVHFPNKELEDISEAFTKKPITNQRAELFAIYIALKTIARNVKFNKISLYTDSEYSIKCLTKWIKEWETNGWKNTKGLSVKNSDLIKVIRRIMDKYDGKIELIHVRSHTGENSFEAKQNDIADELACKGTQKCKSLLLGDRKDVLYIDTQIDEDNINNIDFSKLQPKILHKTKKNEKKEPNRSLRVETEVFRE